MKGSYKMNKSLLLASMMVVALAACGRKIRHPHLLRRPLPGPSAGTGTGSSTCPDHTTAPSTTSSMQADSMKMDAMKAETR